MKDLVDSHSQARARYYRGMFAADQYQLLDFGQGRKLERFGRVILDRPSPAAATSRRQLDELWSSASARFLAGCESHAGCGQRGTWTPAGSLPSRWTIEHPPLTFELRSTEFGHVGLFPEQSENWAWIAKQVERLRALSPGTHPRVLNLFAYTGGSTLAAAAAGAQVVHVDASKGTVAWARRNAALSGLVDAPIRWIVEDAPRFIAREIKRGNRYDGIVLDPPTYGHGPKGQPWQIDRDLPVLLNSCSKLLSDVNGFVLISCHSPGIGRGDLVAWLEAMAKPRQTAYVQFGPLLLRTTLGRQLHCGEMALWSGVHSDLKR
jgi:23S rRNA (cytosine1962-C5)-methyltransferase